MRVYAAEAWVSLALRFAKDNEHIVDMLEKVATDPVPQVRLQIAQNLQVICIAAPDRMWTIAERIAKTEENVGVLASFLGRSLHRFCHSNPERCEAIIETVQNRLSDNSIGAEEGTEHICEALGSLSAQLWVGQGRSSAWDWLVYWSEDTETNNGILYQFLSSLREALFFRYKGLAEPEDFAMCDRAQKSFVLILEKALVESTKHFADATNAELTEDVREAAGKKYQNAEKITHHAMSQLYFGSGAFKSNDKELPGLPNQQSMKQFLTDYSEALSLLENSREPATHHHLIQIYEFLVPGDPVAVFDAVHSILLGPASRDGYQFESLGNDAVVRIVKRYIAENRSIFEDRETQRKLLSILQLFSDVGWPEALKLIYELPDLLR